MSRIHTQMSVPGVSKCHRVQTFLVIGVTITLVTSCWMRVLSLPQLFRKQPTTRRYYPGLIITPLLQGRPGIWLPLRHCLYLPNFLDYELTADRQATLSQAAPSMAAQAAPSMAVLPCCWRCFSYRGSGAVSWCRGEAVASHHFGERYGVRRAASCGLDHGGHLAEVVRAEDAGADDRKHLRVDLLMVVEAVHDSPRNAEHLARADLGLCFIDPPGQHALKPVDRLLVTVMAVRDGHSGSGWDVELEECNGTSRGLAL